MKIIVRKFGCFKNFLLYLETLLHITRLVFVIRKKLMSERSQNSTQILLDEKMAALIQNSTTIGGLMLIVLLLLIFQVKHMLLFKYCWAVKEEQHHIVGRAMPRAPFTFVYLHAFL